MSGLIEDSWILASVSIFIYCDTTEHSLWKVALYINERMSENGKTTEYLCEKSLDLVDPRKSSGVSPGSPNYIFKILS